MRGARPERALDAPARRVLAPVAGMRVVVALSGGPDSVALASLAARIAQADRFDVMLAHVNHGTRPSAGQDECVALAVAAGLGLPIALAHLALAEDDEGTLRTARYEALTEIAQRHRAAIVATAHTAEDQAETVLLALFRGTGPDGLAGMPPRRPLAAGIELVRPLLRATRAELATELRTSGLPYAIDPSNADTRYRRNALRAHLSALRADFPDLDRSIARFAEIARDERDGTPRAEARRRLRDNLRGAAGLRDIGFAEVEAALDAAVDLPPGR
jgi:tRNA(Ile)-lysidine synthase